MYILTLRSIINFILFTDQLNNCGSFVELKIIFFNLIMVFFGVIPLLISRPCFSVYYAFLVVISGLQMNLECILQPTKVSFEFSLTEPSGSWITLIPLQSSSPGYLFEYFFGIFSQLFFLGRPIAWVFGPNKSHPNSYAKFVQVANSPRNVACYCRFWASLFVDTRNTVL